jgi:hypothetical protein
MGWIIFGGSRGNIFEGGFGDIWGMVERMFIWGLFWMWVCFGVER